MYACIDLGSNSFHLLIAKWEDEQSQVVERFSHIVQLGEGVAQTGVISDAAFERGLESLRQFAEVMAKYPIKRYWALGTNALRSAANAPQFIAKAQEMGIDIAVISGEQEAILVYAGVLSGLPRNGATRLIIDIGGGSTEIVIGTRSNRLVTHSLAIGCVSWRDQYFSGDSFSRDALENRMDEAASAAEKIFSSIQDEVLSHTWSESVASSGTAKMLAAVCEQSGYSANGITRMALEDLRADVIACALDPDALLPGLKDKRKELLMPGWTVLTGLMRAYRIETISFSPTALREGMLDHMMHEESESSVSLEHDLLPDFIDPEI